MSCSCPSGFSANTSGNFCEKITISAATVNPLTYVVGAATPNELFGRGGALFHEDITNLSHPIYVSGISSTNNVPISVTTNNGTVLRSCWFWRDSSGRVLDLTAGGPSSGTSCTIDGQLGANSSCIYNNTFGPEFLRNAVWGWGTTNSGRLNNAGVWNNASNAPFFEWIGFSTCINIPSTQTYYVGMAGDDAIRFKLNGKLLVTSSASTASYATLSLSSTALGGYGSIFQWWHVFPITLNSGLNIIELEGLNAGGPAALACEIYSGSLATLTAVTTNAALSALTVFSSANKIGSVFDIGTNGGFSCPDGFSLITCSGAPYCVLIEQTPCIAPASPSPTPTPTPTPTPSPLPQPFYLEYNECEPITVKQMVVDCEILNPTSTPGSTKSMVVYITGGTSPYTVTWSNGTVSSGVSPQLISNLSAGTYTATVVDYWGDFTATTTCTIPKGLVSCENVKIGLETFLECNEIGGVGTGTGLLTLFPFGGTEPYTYSGNVNGVITTITNPLPVNNLDEVSIIIIDYNGCQSFAIKKLISCPSGSEPLNCTTTNCPNGNTYQFDMSATCDGSSVTFNSKLTSNNLNTKVKGSYKISNVDIPNPFLDVLKPSATLDRTKYYIGGTGAPTVDLSDFLEIGFNQLTPNTLTNSDSPWELSIVPYSYTGYVPPLPFTSGTNLTIDIALYDEDYCVHKSSGSIVLPPCDGYTIATTTINF